MTLAARMLAAKKTEKRGWGLVRVSTAAQANVQHGSLEQQRHMLERWAERESSRSGASYQIDRIIEEDISGREASLHKRTGYQEIVRAIKLRQIDFIVFEKLDRLGRSKIENQRFVELADEAAIEVHEVESGIINLRDRGSRLTFNIKNMFAEEYSLELEEKITKKQREAMVNNGKDSSTYPILGLDSHPSKTGMYVINPKEQKIVQDIFETFVRLGSLTALAHYCKEKDYWTKIRMTRQTVDRTGTIIAPKQVGGEPLTFRRLHNLLANSHARPAGAHRFGT